MSETLALKTFAGIYEYCNFIITDEDFKNKILNHLQNVLENWSDSWAVIKKWLLEVEFHTKEQVLKNFIEQIPHLQVFRDVILVFVNRDSNFWENVYDNLHQCQSILKTE